MNYANIITMSMAVALASCSGAGHDGTAQDGQLIGKSEITLDERRLTPEALWAMGRIGDVAVSPDGRQVAYTVAYYSVPQNAGNTEIYVMDADGRNNRRLTSTPQHESGLSWIKDGSKLAFVSNDDGSSQLYEINPDGTGRKKIAHFLTQNRNFC